MSAPATGAGIVAGACRIERAELAPTGDAALFVLRRSDAARDRDVRELWLWRAGAGAARRIDAAGDAVAIARWLPCGRSVVLVRQRDGECVVETLELSAGTPPAEVLRHDGEVADLDVSPDGAHAALAARVAGEAGAHPAVVLEPSGVRRVTGPGHRRDGTGLRDGSTLQVLVADLTTGATRRLAPAPADHETVRWSPDGRWIAAITRGGDPYAPAARLLAADGSGAWDMGAGLAAVKALAWHPASRCVAALAAARLADYDSPDLLLIEVPDGHRRTLVDGEATPWTATAELAWQDDRTLIAGAVHRGGVEILRVDVDGARPELIDRDPAWRHAIGAAGGATAWVEQQPLDPGELVVAGHGRVSAVNRGFRARWAGLVHEPLDVAGDAGPVDAFVTRAPGGSRRPAVFVVHGGPADAAGWDYHELAVLLAARGFAVVRYNPRGSTGRGRAFQRAVQRDYGGGEHRDLRAVVDAVVARGEADPERLAICGHSHGGYMAAWALAHDPRFRAGVVEAPVFDLRSLWATSDAGATWGALVHGGPPWAEPDYYLARSPSTYAHRVTAPTLILGAEGDQRCPLSQAEQMFAHLHAAGCRAELAIYPGADHDTATTPALRADKLDRIAAWLETWLASG